MIIETIVPENGFAYVGQANNLIVTVKNVGTAEATPASGNEADQIIAATFTSTGIFTNYGTVNNVVIAPDESVEIIVAGYTPTVAGTTELTAITDDINRFTEEDETNNTATVNVYAVEEGAVELSLDDTDVDNPFVKVSWENPEGVTADENSTYVIKYVVDGVEITDYVQNTDDNQVVFAETDDEGNIRYYVKNYAKLDNQSEVFVYVVTEDGELPCGVDVAEVDLVISDITVVSEATEANTVYLSEKFSIQVSVKNQGTAKVEASSDDITIDYGKWLITQMALQTNVTIDGGDGLVSSNTGLYAGETKQYTFEM